MLPTIVTAPLLGVSTAVTNRTSPSTSVSLASSVALGITSAVPLGVATASSTATGASLTGSTVTHTRAVSVRSPSLTVYANVAVPATSGLGVYRTSPPVSVAVPKLGVPTAVTVNAAPAAPVSFATSVAAGITTAVSSSVIAVSSTATRPAPAGGSRLSPQPPTTARHRHRHASFMPQRTAGPPSR